MNLYDASTPAPAPTAGSDPLRRMRREQVDRDLGAAIDRIDELGARLAEQEAAEGLEPWIVALLEEISGAEDAPLAFRSLRDRVHRGVLSWADYWADPLAQPSGMVLFHAVMRAELGRNAAIAAERPTDG